MSRSSIGAVRFGPQAGTASTGIRSTRRTRKRNDRDWAPITIEARNEIVHGEAARRIFSTS